MAVYHCTACNIWACTKNHGELIPCRRCSRPLQLAPKVIFNQNEVNLSIQLQFIQENIRFDYILFILYLHIHHRKEKQEERLSANSSDESKAAFSENGWIKSIKRKKVWMIFLPKPQSAIFNKPFLTMYSVYFICFRYCELFEFLASWRILVSSRCNLFFIIIWQWSHFIKLKLHLILELYHFFQLKDYDVAKQLTIANT